MIRFARTNTRSSPNYNNFVAQSRAPPAALSRPRTVVTRNHGVSTAARVSTDLGAVQLTGTWPTGAASGDELQFVRNVCATSGDAARYEYLPVRQSLDGSQSAPSERDEATTNVGHSAEWFFGACSSAGAAERKHCRNYSDDASACRRRCSADGPEHACPICSSASAIFVCGVRCDVAGRAFQC